MLAAVSLVISDGLYCQPFNKLVTLVAGEGKIVSGRLWVKLINRSI